MRLLWLLLAAQRATVVHSALISSEHNTSDQDSAEHTAHVERGGVGQLDSSEEEGRGRRSTFGEGTGRICPTRSITVLVPPQKGAGGARLLGLASGQAGVDWAEFVVEEVCASAVEWVGGVEVECRQRYTQHQLVLWDKAGQEVVSRVYWLPAGCETSVAR